MAAAEIDHFRRDILERTGDRQQADNITDQDLLREVMNTVGKQGRLGESIRCVVSVSMLTEGWDANTVTHVLGVRAFGTQLLCEQVIGRALRRQSYDLNEEGLFNVEYADILGIPFDFAAKPVVAPPQPPGDDSGQGCSSREGRFGNPVPARHGLPRGVARGSFDCQVQRRFCFEFDAGTDRAIEHIELWHRWRGRKPHRRASERYASLNGALPPHDPFALYQWRDPGEEPKFHLFGQLKRITKEWLDTRLFCTGGTYPAQILYRNLADMACERITAAITADSVGKSPIKVLLDPYNPTGSTIHVNFTTSKRDRWWTGDAQPIRCQINWVILDSDWEGEFCRVAESHPRSKPTSKITTWASMCLIAAARRAAFTGLTLSCWWMMATARMTSYIW